MSDEVMNAVMAQYESSTTPKKKKMSDEDRMKLYFSTNLPKNKATGKKRFRILPPKSGKSPFEEVWFHELKVGGQWKKMYCPKKNKSGECPLCNMEKELLNSGVKEDKKIANTYQARKFYIVKGVDRDMEDDGPKFWRFRHNFKKEGILDKIIPVFSEKGDVTNPQKGRDIILTLNKDDDGFTKISSVMPEDAGVLSNDKDKLEAWLNDPMKWEDVYSKPSFEFLEIVTLGEVPYFDKTTDKWISKTEYEAKNESGAVTIIDDDESAILVIGGGKVPETKVEVETKPEAKSEVKTEAKPTTEVVKSKVVAKATPKPKVEPVVEDDDGTDMDMDDLPF